jgi:geranylgeranyl diphosphate synthase type I
MSFDEFISELKRVKGIVDDELRRYREMFKGPLDLVEAAFHLPLSGGKRVRPFILIKSAGLFGKDIEEALPAAIAIELLHNFTLIHDDIMDRDEFRRGVKTTHVLFGESVAIIAGDYLFSIVFNILSKNYDQHVVKSLVELYSNASNLICMGQTMDILPDKYIVDEDNYLEMIYLKTGALIEASAVAGGIIGGASGEELGALRRYGERIGVAFQISDDILGVIGDPKVTGKPVGSDVRNGKRTILVIKGLKRMDEDDKKVFLEVYGNEASSDEEVRRAIDILVSTGVIDEMRSYLYKLYEEALEALEVFPESDDKKYLIDIARFIIERER